MLDKAQVIASRLGLDRYFATMPAGFDTIVGDGITNTLPVGIIQRIAIARALVDRPKLLLFDDANSALDAEGDQRIIELLRDIRGETTIVLVTHRPSLIALADRVFVLESGRLRPSADKPAAGWA
jgi:ATP-binding cassette subfamily C protein LapB